MFRKETWTVFVKPDLPLLFQQLLDQKLSSNHYSVLIFQVIASSFLCELLPLHF
jgi:hypothetical protein